MAVLLGLLLLAGGHLSATRHLVHPALVALLSERVVVVAAPLAFPVAVSGLQALAASGHEGLGLGAHLGLLALQQMLGHALEVGLSLLLLAPEAVGSALEIVVLAGTALPASLGELEGLSPLLSFTGGQVLGRGSSGIGVLSNGSRARWVERLNVRNKGRLLLAIHG